MKFTGGGAMDLMGGGLTNWGAGAMKSIRGVYEIDRGEGALKLIGLRGLRNLFGGGGGGGGGGGLTLIGGPMKLMGGL